VTVSKTGNGTIPLGCSRNLVHSSKDKPVTSSTVMDKKMDSDSSIIVQPVYANHPRKIKAPNNRESSMLQTIGIPISSLFPPFAIQPAKQGVAAKKYTARI